jgi:hypothetical protein
MTLRSHIFQRSGFLYPGKPRNPGSFFPPAKERNSGLLAAFLAQEVSIIPDSLKNPVFTVYYFEEEYLRFTKTN